MDDPRIIELESKIAFLEHTVDELNEVILAVRDQVDRLEKELARTREQVELHAGAVIDPAYRKPPHAAG